MAHGTNKITETITLEDVEVTATTNWSQSPAKISGPPESCHEAESEMEVTVASIKLAGVTLTRGTHKDIDALLDALGNDAYLFECAWTAAEDGGDDYTQQDAREDAEDSRR